jgi:hypothetical protein
LAALKAAFADSAWTPWNVPHDWAIEGTSPPANPFSTSAATTGRGAWVTSGIAWYRKHFTLVPDNNGAVFFQAAITGAEGTPITFSISGPGAIIAVDSGSMGLETFRGRTRNTYYGVAYAIVQATDVGTITVTAESTGLTSGSASVTATVGKFVPCATAATCN